MHSKRSESSWRGLPRSDTACFENVVPFTLVCVKLDLVCLLEIKVPVKARPDFILNSWIHENVLDPKSLS